ncbi:hypothetical protein [Treponema sp.]|uniref:hypothetical protein n=1 Tax=Treponema sp. TaxID=166 RepID=UPI0025E04C72|nr:hypothetical protein [Treponema sp.]MCR5218151.1 hypothetical protein [Treponema sp.]
MSKKTVTASPLSEKVLELQSKIQDKNYINNAIDRIAVIMSRHIVGSKGNPLNSSDLLFR